MTLLSFNVKTLAMCGSIALLFACTQPTKTETQTQKNTEATQVTPDPHAGHTMSNMATASSATNSPAHVAEYKQAMTTMHEQMLSASQITNPDIAFATGMIAHHKGAVDMAKIQLKYGKDSQMRDLAENIIQTQQAEISQMQAWLNNHKATTAPSSTSPTITTMATMSNMDMTGHDAMMQGIMDNDPDVAFVKGMIPHHQGAIGMANTELKKGKDPAMLKLSKQIKSAQEPEIKQMQAWLNSKGSK